MFTFRSLNNVERTHIARCISEIETIRLTSKNRRRSFWFVFYFGWMQSSNRVSRYNFTNQSTMIRVSLRQTIYITLWRIGAKRVSSVQRCMHYHNMRILR